VLQASSDGGLTWWTSAVSVEETTPAVYVASFHAIQPLEYRLVTVGTAAEPSRISKPTEMSVSCAYKSPSWMDWGAGYWLSGEDSVKYGTATHVDGWNSQYLQPTVAVTLYSSIDGVDWTKSATPVTFGGDALRFSIVAAHYLVPTPPIDSVGFYALSMQGLNNGAPQTPQVTGVICLKPEPIFTLSPPHKARAGRSFTVSGLIKPHLPSGTKAVLVTATQLKTNKSLHWSGTVFDKNGFSGYAVKIKLPRAGTWAIRGYVSAGGRWAASPLGKYGAIEAWGASTGTPVKKVVVR